MLDNRNGSRICRQICALPGTKTNGAYTKTISTGPEGLIRNQLIDLASYQYCLRLQLQTRSFGSRPLNHQRRLVNLRNHDDIHRRTGLPVGDLQSMRPGRQREKHRFFITLGAEDICPVPFL